MCGPSSDLKAINTQIKNFTNQVTAEAQTVFQGASSVFNTIVGALTGIVQGGPSQHGFSQNEFNAKTAAAVEAGATEARNVVGAASSALAAIGGGNVTTPSGTTTSILLGAEEKAAADTAAAKNAIISEDFATGRANFFNATKGLESAPGVFGEANKANEIAGGQQKTAFSSQQEMDNQSNWAMNDIMKLGTAFVGGMGGGLGGSLGKGLFPSSTPASSPGDTGFLPSDQGGWGSTGSSDGTS